jgi:hypothetical protein
MINAFRQFFAMFYSLFSAGEKLANSLDKAAEYVEESTDSFLEEARIERIARIKQLMKEQDISELPAPEADEQTKATSSSPVA